VFKRSLYTQSPKEGLKDIFLRILALCLDREFYTRKVIDFLTTAQIPFIIPVKKTRSSDETTPDWNEITVKEYILRENRRST